MESIRVAVRIRPDSIDDNNDNNGNTNYYYH